ncbi:hypothetical protein NPIL_24611 [Nephila pilipes]|uniref:Uncharacterized protein n=1 Tax=Nephila pilipes TaxID=299642 RepID=A0A8X6QQT4_NEPPI|nr:hypothetical protein NPIL_24611 [Nephila pilipes]
MMSRTAIRLHSMALTPIWRTAAWVAGVDSNLRLDLPVVNYKMRLPFVLSLSLSTMILTSSRAFAIFNPFERVSLDFYETFAIHIQMKLHWLARNREIAALTKAKLVLFLFSFALFESQSRRMNSNAPIVI